MAEEKRLGDLNLHQTVFFLCDMQEKFRPAIKFFPEIIEVAKRLVNICLLGAIEMYIIIIFWSFRPLLLSLLYSIRPHLFEDSDNDSDPFSHSCVHLLIPVCSAYRKKFQGQRALSFGPVI